MSSFWNIAQTVLIQHFFHLITYKPDTLTAQSFQKYHVISMYISNISEAHQQCQQQYGTDLASIHNDSDMTEAQSVCSSISDTFYGCWIGLTRNRSSSIADTFYWRDGSEWNFGNIHLALWTKGQYPWATAAPVAFMSTFSITPNPSENPIATITTSTTTTTTTTTITRIPTQQLTVTLILLASVFALCCICYVVYEWHKRYKTKQNHVQLKGMKKDGKEIKNHVNVSIIRENMKMAVVLGQIKASKKHKTQNIEELYMTGIQQNTTKETSTGELNVISELKPTIEGDPGDNLAHDHELLGKGEHVQENVLKLTVEGNIEHANIGENDDVNVTDATKHHYGSLIDLNSYTNTHNFIQ